MLFSVLSRNREKFSIILENMASSQKGHNILCLFWDGMKSYLERKIDVEAVGKA